MIVKYQSFLRAYSKEILPMSVLEKASFRAFLIKLPEEKVKAHDN